MNPRPSGCFTNLRKPCKCSALQIDRYLARISGPLLERIDFCVAMPAVPISSPRDIKVGRNSAWMRSRGPPRPMATSRCGEWRFGESAVILTHRLVLSNEYH